MRKHLSASYSTAAMTKAIIIATPTPFKYQVTQLLLLWAAFSLLLHYWTHLFAATKHLLVAIAGMITVQVEGVKHFTS